MSDKRPGPAPGDDPYEFEWPDDAQEQRAAEREADARKALNRPAPRLLTAIVVGISTVLLFIMPVALIAGAPAFIVAVAAPIVIAGLVLAFPPAALLEYVSRGWRRGFAELAFVLLGFALGAGWTWVALSLFVDVLFADPRQMPSVRAPSAVFMGTAVASALLAAKMFTDGLRRSPKVVYSIGGFLALLTALSIYANLAIQPA